MSLTPQQLARFEEWRSTMPLSSALATPEEIFTAGYTAALRDSEAVEWISVKQRMPDEGQSVLYYFDVVGVHSGKYGGDDVFYGASGFLTGDVTHWMPLPAAPAITLTANTEGK